MLLSDVMTALPHVVAFRRRQLHNNQISSLADGTFAGLTALTVLYVAGLWIGVQHGARGFSTRSSTQNKKFENRQGKCEKERVCERE